MPAPGASRTSANSVQSRRSTGVRGGRPARRRPSWPGAGSARRSSLPLTVSGSASSVMIALGTM
ncbi:hypothetical protein LUX32_00620 [Actinomadura madurae]|nr:hypothetical protein [Actinomadura madurae]MCP9976348.1 hypothetical protein [Actinomadura madurae]